MALLITDADRKKDKKIVKKLTNKYKCKKSIEIMWYSCIVEQNVYKDKREDNLVKDWPDV